MSPTYRVGGPASSGTGWIEETLKKQPAAPAKQVQLAVKSLPPGTYRLNTYRVDYRQNDAYSAYLALGRPTY